MDFVGIEKVSELVHMNETTIRRWIKKGLFPRGIEFKRNRIGWLPINVERWYMEGGKEKMVEMKLQRGKKRCQTS